MASIPNKKMRGRTILVAALLIIVGFGLVIHQLYRVQLVEGESYKQEAASCGPPPSMPTGGPFTPPMDRY